MGTADSLLILDQFILQNQTEDTTDLAPLVRTLASMAIGALTIGGIYYGREVLLPISLAVLLSFVLAPPTSFLQKLHFPRALSVVLVVAISFGALFAIGGIFVQQIKQLAEQLPIYQSTISKKIEYFREKGAARGTLERANGILKGLSREIEKPNEEVVAPAAIPADKDTALKPLPVEVRQPEPTALESLRILIAPLLHPLATTGITVIFVMFILMQREDLRDRMIRLGGARDIHRTTAALDDAASRLSRFFLIQLLINIVFGAVICLGLWLIGIPNPVLWGILAAILRFVPYVGAVAAALFPLILALAVDPDWTMFLTTLALFIIVEPILGHVIEPMAYGRSTGLSPIAVVASATFWTALWGPVGLILATPLTVCLVVLGRHIERLKFLDIMFGDRPALTPSQIFYHRMLANDVPEAMVQAEKFMKERPFASYCDEIALPGLKLAQADYDNGNMNRERLKNIQQAVDELCTELRELENVTEQADPISTTDPETASAVETADAAKIEEPLGKLDAATLPADWKTKNAVACFAGRSPFDESASVLLSTLLSAHGLNAYTEKASALAKSHEEHLKASTITIACLVSLEGQHQAYSRFTSRRLRRMFPKLKVILVSLSDNEGDVRTGTQEIDQGDKVARTLSETVRTVLLETPTPSERVSALPDVQPGLTA